ncbi:alpha-E domain-containing protein [Hymenobacter profundi]|uniref:Alpha-E domain-containing protein n=1 Tax=Hymenobacter profundi TaxID=1982110 RepID=A0ABS6X4X6_9BACT|nr:alpha-E domain-containing protein [Hymenobacter profundi]MBW3130884.1 alpha-E domain-containing protein [Hymenobacter profundi]
MLSRVADTIYWLARYMERTQSMLQVIRTNYIASQNEIYDFNWRPFLQLYGDLTPDELAQLDGHSTPILTHLVLDRNNGASAYRNILQGRENARAVQDHITKEVWQSLNDFYHVIRDPEVGQQITHEDPISGLDALLRQALLYAGTVQHTMPRDEGYAYLGIGKCLERAIQTTDILRVRWATVKEHAVHPLDAPALRYLLYSLVGYEQYIKTYKGTFNTENVLQFIVYNTQFPHALLYSLDQLAYYFGRLQPESLPESHAHVAFLIGKVRTAVRYSRLSAQEPEQLTSFLLQTRQQLLDVASALNTSYFGYN